MPLCLILIFGITTNINSMSSSEQGLSPSTSSYMAWRDLGGFRVSHTRKYNRRGGLMLCKLMLWSNASKVGERGWKGRSTNTYGPAIEQEESALSLPEQPAMPTPDSKGYPEWIKKETLNLPASSLLCQLSPAPFVLPLLKIHINISKSFLQQQ